MRHAIFVSLAVLSVLATVGACERRRERADTLHVIPPPPVLAQAGSPAPAFHPAPAPATPKPATPSGDDAPSAEEVKAFQEAAKK